MAFNNNEVAVGECCLQKPRFDKVAWSFLDADGFAVVPITMPTRAEFRDDWSNQAFFQKNSGFVYNQPTVLLGMVAFLGPKK